MSRHVASSVLACALALPAAASAAPKIVSAEITGNPLVGEPLTVQIVASDARKAITGLVLEDSDGERFEESACAVTRSGKPSKRGAFAPGRNVSFALPYTPRRAGVQILNTKVTSGGCGSEPESTSSRLAVTVTLPSVPTVTPTPLLPDVPLPVALSTGRRTAHAAAACNGADTLPTSSNGATMRSAILCLMNAQRRAAGLPILRTARKLRDAALYHAADMVRRGYFAHSGPGGPDLASRLKQFGFWPAVAGENLGRASSRVATPATMVAAWMRSEPHRTNMLTATFRHAGIGVAAGSGGTVFAVDFGRR